MNSRVKLAVETLTPSLAAACRVMARRSRAVELVEDVADAVCLITDWFDPAATARAGKMILQLNPFELDSDDRHRLAETGKSMPGLVTRFRPSIAEVRQALDAGRLGEPGLLRIHCWNRTADSVTALSEQVDLALWILGDVPDHLCAVERAGYRQVHCGFASGGMALIDLDTGVYEDSPYYSLSLIGSNGAAYADDHHNMNLLMTRQGVSAEPVTESGTALAAMIDHFATSVRDGLPLSPCWSETLAVSDACEQVRLSVQQQQTVAGGQENA